MSSPRLEGTFLYHTNCEVCGSSDAKAVYTSGTAFCFSCQHFFKLVDAIVPDQKEQKKGGYALFIQDGQFKPLEKRGITLETCIKFGYQVGEYRGKVCQIAPYYNSSGALAAQHLRFPNKDFKWVGDVTDLQLYGQQLWRDGGKRVVITEGEVDAMSVSQVFGNKWPVVSLPSGAQSAKKYLKMNMEWVEKFDEIILGFDNDEQGKKAVKECAPLFKAGKVKVVNWAPYKDANDYLQAGESAQVAPLIFGSKTYRPDGIISGSDLSLEFLMEQDEVFAFDTPYPKINRLLRGVRKGEITMFAAGSGIGKSTLVREIAYHLLMEHNLKIGYVALEENVKKTALGLMAINLNVPMGELFLNRKLVTEEKFINARDRVIDNGRLYLYDHFGSLDSENLLMKLRYLAVACEIDFIVLDHISIVVSGIAEGDERRIIDNLMTQLRALVESTGVGMLVITHLKVPENSQKAHEEGGRVTLSQLRGSGALKQLSDSIIALERDQQGEDPNISQTRVLKNRLLGMVGVADIIRYDSVTGRLEATDETYGEISAEQPQEDSPF